MIGKLRGIVDATGDGWAIIDVGGVGYEVACSVRTLRALKDGEETTLAIETYVREDAIRLFGFPNENERQWFRLLQNVQGVGAKVALAVLGTLSPQDLANAIALADKAAVAQTPGVGPKVAQRIVTELKDKAPALTAAGISLPSAGKSSRGGAAMPDSAGAEAAEAVSALKNLGYQPMQASTAVAAAMKDLGKDAGTAALIRRGLKELAG